MGIEAHTLIGKVDAVRGNLVSVRLNEGIPNIMMVDGRTYRIGQVGGFVRIPLGFSQLYAVCTLVGASLWEEPAQSESTQATGALLGPPSPVTRGRKALQVALFGEAIGERFERGITQYPTIDDDVHLVTQEDMRIIYSSVQADRTVTVGHIAAASAIKGCLDLGLMVSRHTAIVGSTGSGKSNLVAVLLEAIATQNYPSARVLLIDPHGEYASALADHAYVFKPDPATASGEKELRIPYWALPFDELKAIAFGDMQPMGEAAIRDEIVVRKRKAAKLLPSKPPEGAITADSPVPFSLRGLWFDLTNYENRTFTDNGCTTPSTPTRVGDAQKLVADEYPPAALGSAAPYKNKFPRGIWKQLELCRSRMLDTNYQFLFGAGELDPDIDGKCLSDLDKLVSAWVGHDRPVSVLDVSGVPTASLPAVVGTLIRIVYDMLFWGRALPVGGRKQPLLVVLEEAHLFLPEGRDSPAHRAVARIAREGRKYGVGMCVVSQRPSEVDATVLSQCGTMIALRLSNQQDRAKVQNALPDDIGALSAMLPALRTGEGVVVGEAMPIPSRIRFFRASRKPIGDDPRMPQAWREQRPDPAGYAQALANWRRQSATSK